MNGAVADIGAGSSVQPALQRWRRARVSTSRSAVSMEVKVSAALAGTSRKRLWVNAMRQCTEETN
jgi:hypothetical protein